MGLFSWFFGHNKLPELDVKDIETELIKVASISKSKLHLCDLISKNSKKENSLLKLKQILNRIQKINLNEFNSNSKNHLIARLNNIPIKLSVKNHLIKLIEQYIQSIKDQESWFNQHQTLEEMNENIDSLFNFIRVENQLLFDVVHHDFNELDKEIKKIWKSNKKLTKDLVELKDLKKDLDIKLLELTDNFKLYKEFYFNKSDEINKLIEGYRFCLEFSEDIKKNKTITSSQRIFLDSLVNDIHLKIHQLDAVHGDPFVNPFSNNLKPSQAMFIIHKLKPCHIIPSKESLIAILKSGKLQSKVETKKDRGRYMEYFKGQKEGIFFSAGGPFIHLSLENPNNASLIIFKKNIYNITADIFPRDSGGYPEEIIADITSKNSKELVQQLINRRKFKNVNMMYKYMYSFIKHHGLKESFPESIVGLKIPKKNVALFPEGVVMSEISFDYIETILIPEEIFYSPEINEFRNEKKYKKSKLFTCVPKNNSPLKYYWKFVGLKEYLFKN